MLLINLVVAAAKLTVGYLTGSVSIISDGFHSLTDSSSNVIGLVGLRAARKPPDEDHPYGHRKYETLAAGGIFVFLFLAVFEVGRAALRDFATEGPTKVSVLSFGVMIATMAVNIWVVRSERAAGRRLKSELLMADALHTRSDVYTSMAVLASLTGVWAGYPILDPVGGLVVAGFIGHTGYQVGREMSRILSDRMVIDEADIRQVVMSVPEVKGCHHIRSRGSTDYVFLDLHVWFSPDMTLERAHGLSHVVKDRLIARWPQIADAIIHLEPPPRQS